MGTHLRSSFLSGLTCFFSVVSLGVKCFKKGSYGFAQFVVFFREKQGGQVILEFFSVSNDFQIQFFHFLGKLNVHLVDFGIEFLVLLLDELRIHRLEFLAAASLVSVATDLRLTADQ